jgi:hypothetical protein
MTLEENEFASMRDGAAWPVRVSIYIDDTGPKVNLGRPARLFAYHRGELRSPIFYVSFRVGPAHYYKILAAGGGQ